MAITTGELWGPATSTFSRAEHVMRTLFVRLSSVSNGFAAAMRDGGFHRQWDDGLLAHVAMQTGGARRTVEPEAGTPLFRGLDTISAFAGRSRTGSAAFPKPTEYPHLRRSKGANSPEATTPPCPMCDDAHVESHQEMVVATVFVCLACGYRFAQRVR
jgi:hypothetical protein